ncbi:MAG: DUF1326 domain-containing protein, partial [Acidobacteria bacterium]|nr:DUF1326 domain-containing protein [Acidobacteriota bacterium]
AGGLLFAAAPAIAGPNGTITGDYVEARTAEVFAGGCVMGSEAETMGRQAVAAWRIERGSFNGVMLDGLAVVAAFAGDRNLGIREIGGTAPALVRAAIMIDDRASPAQRDALLSLARELANGLADNVVDVRSVPIVFERKEDVYAIAAGDAKLVVSSRLEHDPSCGAMQWFHPLARGTQAAVGLTKTQIYWGGALGSRWQQADKRSAFVGTFAY